VLGLPLAFILSQDQTLLCIFVIPLFSFCPVLGLPCLELMYLPYLSDFRMLGSLLSKNLRNHLIPNTAFPP
ncbi:MAG: hypothetical protein MJZ90_07250, partial [Bacteroidales bacterium]|nr:hypothetical protein [Bacteroidales bacterium]